MRNLAAAVTLVVAAPVVAALVVTSAMPVLAQQLPHGAQEFFAPESKAPPRVMPFAPNPDGIFYENSAVQVFRDLPQER
jgi:hypothetical protein